ncbi:hypothetical protein RND71_021860 [Anisodus tanguticus]|uniref:Uncharacterized protein n=1 Tax=Anisodus tanguticus TaxID=243964 RepID=A0AAE1RZ90_9SOLA|nr:hypothetical protein RND71_021860 [Anisodus tanguticus]
MSRLRGPKAQSPIWNHYERLEEMQSLKTQDYYLVISVGRSAELELGAKDLTSDGRKIKIKQKSKDLRLHEVEVGVARVGGERVYEVRQFRFVRHTNFSLSWPMEISELIQISTPERVHLLKGPRTYELRQINGIAPAMLWAADVGPHIRKIKIKQKSKDLRLPEVEVGVARVGGERVSEVRQFRFVRHTNFSLSWPMEISELIQISTPERFPYPWHGYHQIKESESQPYSIESSSHNFNLKLILRLYRGDASHTIPRDVGRSAELELGAKDLTADGDSHLRVCTFSRALALTNCVD